MVVVITGVSGSGKTTVGEALARRLGWAFEDADEFHSPANVEKMRAGVPLTDADREPWLRALARAIQEWDAAGRDVVLAASALRRPHRDRLRGAVSDPERVPLVFLRGDPDLIAQRLRARAGHFMPASLLKSQFDTLETPGPDEALVVDVQPPVPEIVESIVRGLRLGGATRPSC